MTTRRPLVLDQGVIKELPLGDSVAGAVSGVLPFYKANGTFDAISLTTSQEVPFFRADGTQDNIPLVT